MDKRALSEPDIVTKFILDAQAKRGWDLPRAKSAKSSQCARGGS